MFLYLSNTHTHTPSLTLSPTPSIYIYIYPSIYTTDKEKAIKKMLGRGNILMKMMSLSYFPGFMESEEVRSIILLHLLSFLSSFIHFSTPLTLLFIPVALHSTPLTPLSIHFIITLSTPFTASLYRSHLSTFLILYHPFII